MIEALLIVCQHYAYREVVAEDTHHGRVIDEVDTRVL
jgi:hypothetical protein